MRFLDFHCLKKNRVVQKSNKSRNRQPNMYLGENYVNYRRILSLEEERKAPRFLENSRLSAVPKFE